jgi:hypothetical protein
MFWENRYQQGGTSGAGSIGWERRWKWKLIRRYVGDPDEVLDVGCGDLSFWDGRDCARYVGLDLSPYILKRNESRRPQWSFQLLDATVEPIPFQKRIVFCFDVLFHVLPEERFQYLLRNLVGATREWLFVTNWGYNPLPRAESTDGVYQVYRDLGDYLELFEPLRPIGIHPRRNRPKVFYAFQRRE